MKPNFKQFLPIFVRFRPILIGLISIFIRLFPIIERFVPVFASYVLEGFLKPLKAKGSIEDYRTRTVRISRFHYRIDIRIVVTKEQVNAVLINLLTKIPRTFRGSNDSAGKTVTKEEDNLENKIAIKPVRINSIDTEIDEISKRILLELEGASSKELSDVHYAKMILHLSDIHYAKRVMQDIGKLTSEAQGEIEKRAVIKVLLFSTWLQRLYFIIRSFLMGLISAAATFLLVLSVGTIDAITGAIFGIFVFILSLVITRLFDAQITKGTKKIIEIMAGHRTVRDFVMKHF